MSLLDDEDDLEAPAEAPAASNGSETAAEPAEVASAPVDAQGESSILPRFREQEEGV
jgi:hypothetical protein